MSVDWPLTAIDDIKAPEKGSIAIGPFGSRMKSDCYVDKGIPVIRGTNITDGPSFAGEFVYITKEKADSLGSSNVYKNDLVFPHRGAIGEVGIVLKDERYVLSSSLMKLTCDVVKANPKFIYYFFKSRLGRHELLKNASQVGTPGIGQPLTSLKGVELKLPPKDVQDRIANILSSLDEKIEANRKTNQILEQIAQALFKSWFVDFDPVKAKIAALEAGGGAEDAELAAMGVIAAKTREELAELKQAKPETYQNLARTAALFPSAMQESELGEIPEGWNVKSVGDYLETISKTYPLKSVSDVVFLNTGDIQNGRFLHSKKSSVEGLPGQAKKSIQKGDILYSEIRPENKRFAYVHFDAGEYVVSTKLMVLRSSGVIKSEFLYFILTQQCVIDHLQVMAETRSGTFPQITFDILSKVKLLVPSQMRIIENFTDFVLFPILKKYWITEVENQQAANIRDILLPRLLSGELKVRNEASA